jgi:hypothetical protein
MHDPIAASAPGSGSLAPLRRALAASLLVLALGALGALGACAPASGADEDVATGDESALTLSARAPGSTFHAWAASFQAPRGTAGTDSPTVAANGTTTDDAHAFDLIVDLTNKTYPNGKKYDAATIAAMHRENPRLKFLVYLNGCCNLGPAELMSSFPDSSYAHTAGGARITSADGTPMMNRRDRTWFQSRASECHTLMTNVGYDGCFYDSFGARWFIQAGSGTPIDPLTNATWTATNYVQVGGQMLGNVRAANAGALVGINGLGSGPGYFSAGWDVQGMLPAVDMAMAEDFLVTPTTSATTYESVDRWKQEVAMVQDVVGKGKTFLATVKLWSSATAAQEAQWSKFAEGTLLLATDSPRAYLDFQNEHSAYAPTQYYPWYNVSLGSATTSTYAVSGGCYVRPYTNGVVVVNPAPSGACSYALGGTFTDLEGRAVSTASLGAHSADIYVKR